MAGIDDHLQQWMSNRTLLEKIPDEWPDWMATIAFYAAVHAVEAVFALDNVHSNGHDARNLRLKRVNKYSFLHLNFQPLFNAAFNARYHCKRGWLPVQNVKNILVPNHLYAVEKGMYSALVKAAKLPAWVPVPAPKLWAPPAPVPAAPLPTSPDAK